MFLDVSALRWVAACQGCLLRCAKIPCYNITTHNRLELARPRK